MPPRTMFGARVRSRQPAEHNMLSPSGYGKQDRRFLCESYFSIATMDGGGAHTPHGRGRWPAIASGSRREWSHHITPAIPTGGDPSSIRRYEWRRQKARRDITTQSPRCVGPWRRLRTAVDWCRVPAVYCDNMERIARRQGATREEELLFFSFLFFFLFFSTHTHI